MRGTSGSGKSHLGFQFVETYPWQPVVEDGWLKGYKTKQVAYKLPGLYVLGRYNSGVPTGGVDGWEYHKVLDLVERLAAEGHVYVELRSSFGLEYISRWKNAYGITVCYLDTPIDKCVEQVYKRREHKRMNDKLNVEAMEAQRNQLMKQMKTYDEIGIPVALIDHTNAFNAVRSILWKAGWRPDEN